MLTNKRRVQYLGEVSVIERVVGQPDVVPVLLAAALADALHVDAAVIVMVTAKELIALEQQNSEHEGIEGQVHITWDR